jgi:hypothetical protein
MASQDAGADKRHNQHPDGAEAHEKLSQEDTDSLRKRKGRGMHHGPGLTEPLRGKLAGYCRAVCMTRCFSPMPRALCPA